MDDFRNIPNPTVFESWPADEHYGPTPPGMLGRGRGGVLGGFSQQQMLPLSTAIIRDPHHYTTPNTVTYTPGTASTLIADVAPSDSPRNFLMLRNSSTGAEVIYIAFGQTASIASAAFSLSPGQVILLDIVCPQSDIYAIGDAATATCTITQGFCSYGF